LDLLLINVLSDDVFLCRYVVITCRANTPWRPCIRIEMVMFYDDVYMYKSSQIKFLFCYVLLITIPYTTLRHPRWFNHILSSLWTSSGRSSVCLVQPYLSTVLYYRHLTTHLFRVPQQQHWPLYVCFYVSECYNRCMHYLQHFVTVVLMELRARCVKSVMLYNTFLYQE